MTRQHPIKILSLMYSGVWLLIIPLVRGIVSLDSPQAFRVWLTGVWLDLLVVAFIVGTAVVRWRCVSFDICKDGISFRRGVFIRHYGFIPTESISVAEGEKKFLLRPFGAVVVHISSDSGKANDVLTLTMRYRDYARLFSELAKKKRSGIKASYRPKKLYLILFSTIFSSALSGVLFISTFFIESGKILVDMLEGYFLTTVDEVSSHLDAVIDGIPKIVVAVVLILLIGWVCSLVINLLRYTKFRIERVGRFVSVRSGFFTQSHCFIDASKIFFADMRQNLLMKLCGIISVQVSCAGYSRRKSRIPVFIPINKRKDVLSTMRILLPSSEVSPPTIKPSPKSFFRYIFLPVFIIPSVVAVMFPIIHFFPLWKDVAVLLSVTAEVLSVIFLTAKIVAYFSTGISVGEDTICIQYSMGINFRTVIIPKRNIAKISLTQSIFARRYGYCNMTFFSASRLISPHFVIGIPLADAEKILSALDSNTGI